jgi:hypothetical protein
MRKAFASVLQRIAPLPAGLGNGHHSFRTPGIDKKPPSFATRAKAAADGDTGAVDALRLREFASLPG